MNPIRIFGYTDTLSVKPGETLRFMVSAEGTATADTALVRLIHGDAHPDGPGFVEEHVPGLDGTLAVGPQFTQVGNFATVHDPAARLAPTGDFALFAFIWPTLPGSGRQSILSRRADGGGDGYELAIAEDGCLEISLHAAGRSQTLRGERPLRPRCWYLVGASVAAADGSLTLYQESAANRWNGLHSPAIDLDDACHRTAPLQCQPGRPADAVFLLAGRRVLCDDGRIEVATRYNGKIDRCGVVGRALSRAEFDELRAAPVAAAPAGSIAFWDPSQGYGEHGIGDLICDRGPWGLHALGYNRPVRGMTGYNWRGRDDSYRLAPEQYGGVHFHDDALIDCCWTPSREWTVPAGLRSGCYALRLRAGEAEEYLPFFVRPAQPRARLAVLIPTASYLAYANEQLSFTVPVVQPIFGRTPVLSESDFIRVERTMFGLSTYDTHSDGAGVCFSSCRRPILNMRPKYRMAIGCTWQFPADLSLIGWLEHQGIAYDVLTDEDLHREGAACLAPYRVVLSGSHPEYYSGAMLDATEDYLAGGGRLIYTGANGYYWAVSFRDDEPWCMEVRKLESGSRAWQAMPGEYYNQTEPVRSGLWRNRGRPPQKLLGVGFATEGFDMSSSYARLPDADDTAMRWVFEGVSGPVFGDFGLALGGAAGLELDRYDRYLGTPPKARLLASSQGHSDNYPRVSEEIYYNFAGQGASQDYQCRGDMVYFRTRNEGAVFATGSIAWTSALPVNGFDNAVSRIMANVVDAFLHREALPD